MTKKSLLIRRFLSLSKYLNFFSLLFPLASALGWIYGIPLLAKGFRALPAMQPNTIIFLLLTALAIHFSQKEGARSFLTCSLAVIIFLFGCITLSEYLFDLDFGIDQILIQHTSMETRPFPGRASPQTSLNFILLGVAIFSFKTRFMGIFAAQICALLAGTNALIVATGYIFTTAQFSGFPIIEPAVGMSLSTSLGFVLLTGALLCSKPEEGIFTLLISETQSGALARQILLAGVLLPPLLGALTRVGVQANWYNVNTQVSLFTVILIGLMLGVTWKSARRAESEELRAKSAFDMTSRALEEREIYFALIENSSDFIGIADANGLPTYVNTAGRRMVGLPADCPVNKTQIPEYYPPELRPFVSNVIVKSMLEQGHWMGDTYFRNWQTQEAIPVSDTHFMIRDPASKQVLGMGTITRDITEAKRIEKEQKFLTEFSSVLASSLDYENTLENIVKLAVRDLADFCIIYLVEEKNEIRRLKARSRDSSKTWICELLMNTPFEQKNPGLLAKVLETQSELLIEHLSSEIIPPLSHGEEHLQVLNAMSIQSFMAIPLLIYGKLIGVITFISSSPSHFYGAKDLRLAKEIAYHAQFSIENARLYREAQQAVKTREEVLAIVSHDLKNPLAAIEIIAKLLPRLNPKDLGQLSDFAHRIQYSVEQMNKLIGDLLDFAKVQSGTFSIERFQENTREVLLPVTEALRPLAEAKRKHLEVSIPSELPPIDCDAFRIRQVLSNLLGNALKFTPEEGSVRVAARAEKSGVLVSVSDTGPGIQSEQLPKVFDRFWQAQETKHLGSGLGLAIAKGIMEAHGSKIWAESQVGKGSSFYFIIPLANSKTRKKESPQTGPALAGNHILLVDDARDIRFLFRYILERAGAKVSEAPSVSEALSKLAQEKPQLIITDIEMPDGNGYDLLKKVRQIAEEENFRLPVAALTAHTHEAEIKKIREAGFGACFSKSIAADKLISSVQQLINDHRFDST
ncbi:MAG: ATP-binding protein [Pseudobdellovibrionaceae bacterium]